MADVTDELKRQRAAEQAYHKSMISDSRQAYDAIFKMAKQTFGKTLQARQAADKAYASYHSQMIKNMSYEEMAQFNQAQTRKLKEYRAEIAERREMEKAFNQASTQAKIEAYKAEHSALYNQNKAIEKY